MSRTRKPLGLRLSEQDLLEQLPALGAWTPPAQAPLPGPGQVLVEITARRERRA